LEYRRSTMPRASNPAAKVLEFFETQPLAVADTVFALVRSVMASRTKQEDTPPRKKRRKRQKQAGLSSTPPVSEAVPLGQKPPRAKGRRRTKAEIEEANRRMSAVNAAIGPPRPPRPPGLVEKIGEEESAR